jgi:hypothetical protein
MILPGWGPSRNIPLWMATSVLPAMTSVAASTPVPPANSRRIVTTARRLTMPMMVMRKARP